MRSRLLDPHEQPHALVDAAQRAGITHGETCRADISGVNVVGRTGSDVRFCTSSMSKRQTVVAGDGTVIPDDTDGAIEGYEHLRGMQGLHLLENALVTSNGSLTVTVDNLTRVVHTDAIHAV